MYNFYVQRDVEEAGVILMVLSNKDLHSVLCSVETSGLALEKSCCTPTCQLWHTARVFQRENIKMHNRQLRNNIPG